LGALADGARGIVVAATVLGSLTLVAFVPAALVLGPVAGALVGLAIYCGLVALLRPRELRSSWAYLRALR